MRTVLYTNIDEKVITEWQSLWEKTSDANYTNSPQWFLSVLETFNYTRYAVIAIYEKDALIAIAGLIKEKSYGTDVYTVAPSDFVCGKPFLINQDSHSAMYALEKAMMDLGIVRLENIPEEFMNALKNVTETEEAYTAENYYLDIHKDEKGEVSIRHKKRLLRRSESIEDQLVFRTFTGSDSEAFGTIFSIDKKSKKQLSGYNIFSDESMKKFYTSLANHFKEKFTIFILYHEKKPVAYQIGFSIKSTFFCSQISSLKEYEEYSIGRSLLIKVIEHLGNVNIQTLDFGSGEDHVKKSLTKQQRPLYSVIIAKNKMMRTYLKYISETRSTMYSYLHKRRKFYATYRIAKNFMHLK